MFAPPFRGPHNHNLDPLLPIMIDLVGAAMHQRFIAEDKPGSTMRKGASYSTWWNGGLRTTVYYHNMIGLLTETIGHPTPMEVPLRVDRQLGTGDMPFPIAPQKWHFRQSVEYSLTANRAVLDMASRYREHHLFNIYRMGKNSIDKGNKDSWTVRPDTIAAAKELQEQNRKQDGDSNRQDVWETVFRDPRRRDPRGYVIPRDQADFPTATKFVNTLIKQGIAIHRATDDFEMDGRSFRAGSYVVRCAQAFRPHIIDMFEPQVHPDDIPYPGGAPIPPYDSAGWTLAYQMGVKFHRVLDGFEGPFEPVKGFAAPPPGRVTGGDTTTGFFTSTSVNDAFLAANRLLERGARVSRITKPCQSDGVRWPEGSFFVHARSGLGEDLTRLATELGLDFAGASAAVPSDHLGPIRRMRIGLWDRYGGSMPSGWLRWVLERFEFDFELVFAQELDAGDLRERFDAIVFVGGAIPSADRGEGRRRRRRRRRGPPNPADIPEQYRDRLGRVTITKTVPKLREFLNDGGTILTIGSSTALARHLELPVRNALQRIKGDGTPEQLPREEYFVPGSVLSMRMNPSHPIAWGSDQNLDVYFRRSPVFRVRPEGGSEVRPVGWFDSPNPLRSGWAWGQHHLEDGVGIVEARVGKGSLVLYGPEVTFRAQPHSTFKLIFNGLMRPAEQRER